MKDVPLYVPEVIFASLLLAACHRLTPMEQKIVGSWSWQYIEGRGRMIFSADHKVREGMPPDHEVGHPLRDEDFKFLEAGTWRLEGDVLVTELDNSPFIAWYDQTFRDEPEDKRRRDRPVFKKEIRRERIVKIDSKKMVFEDGSWLDREK